MRWESHERRTKRRRVVEAWKQAIRDELARVREGLDQGRDDVIPDDVLIEEVLALGRAGVVPAVDVVLPAPRLDLVNEWLTERLMRRADMDAERQALARRLAPLPDESPPGRRPFGVDREAVNLAIEYEAKRRREQ